jgi:hypothetical protein
MTRRHLLTTTLAASLPTLARSAPTPYRVAIIGHTGRGNYGHGLDTMWQYLPNTKVVAIADADPKGLAAAQTKLKLDRAYADYTTMLNEVKPDLVAIGPRHIDQHLAMVLAATQAGARGIYMEKPFCRSPQEADEIIAACAKSNTKLALAHRNRYHPALQACQKLIAAGTIGRLLEVRCRGKEDTRGGTLDLALDHFGVGVGEALARAGPAHDPAGGIDLFRGHLDGVAIWDAEGRHAAIGIELPHADRRTLRRRTAHCRRRRPRRGRRSCCHACWCL